MREDIEVGFQAFVSDAVEEFGAIREISPDGKVLTVYVENAGDFFIPASAVVSVVMLVAFFRDCTGSEQWGNRQQDASAAVNSSARFHTLPNSAHRRT